MRIFIEKNNHLWVINYINILYIILTDNKLY